MTSRTDLRPLIKKTIHLTVAYSVLGFVFCFPTKIQNYNFVHITEGLTVSISKNSPPLAILEDEFIKPLEMAAQKTIIPKRGEVLLAAGTRIFEPKLDAIEKERSRVSLALSRVDSTVDKKQKQTEVASIEPIEGVQKEVEASTTIMLSGLSLSAKEAVRVVINDVEERVGATEGDAVPSFGEAFKSNTKVLEKSNAEERGREAIPEEELADLPVAKTIPVIEHRRSDEEKPRITYPKSVQEQQPVASAPTDFDGANTESAQKIASRKLLQKQKNISQALIGGSIELTNGLALIDGANLEVFHEVLGSPLERGNVSLQEGRYQIIIQDPNEGTLVAEVRDSDGLLLGRTSIAIDELDYTSNNSGTVTTFVNLRVAPVANNIEGKVASLYTPEKGEKDVGVAISGLPQQIKTNKKGEFLQTKVLHDSQLALTTTKKGFWGTVLLTDNSQNIEVGLYPDKMIRALAQMAKAEPGYEKEGIIWGRVESNGKPVAGAVVESSYSTAIGPIYFNSLQLPDIDLKETSQNGLFAFIEVAPGLHIVKASREGKDFPTKVAMVESGSVSQVNVESSAHKKARVAFYDAFASSAIKAELRFSGTENVAFAEDGLLRVRYNTGRDLLFLEAEADYNYLPVRQVLMRDVSFINFPMVKRSWLEEILNSSRINRIPQTAIAIGFVQGLDFDVVAPDGVPIDVIYFDQAGQNIGSEGGVANGGFVLANVPSGLQSIGIVPKNKNAIATKVFFADPSQVSLINYRF